MQIQKPWIVETFVCCPYYVPTLIMVIVDSQFELWIINCLYRHFKLLISAINCWHPQFQLSISLMRNSNNTNFTHELLISTIGIKWRFPLWKCKWNRYLIPIVDIDNSNCWYQQLVLLQLELHVHCWYPHLELSISLIPIVNMISTVGIIAFMYYWYQQYNG